MSVPQQRSTRRLIQIEAPSVTKHIARTLGRYPDGGQILKELIQNADDAEATEVKFILDTRQYPSDHLINPALSQFQGPSLYAWNNAVFKDKDWDYFGKMEDSSKEKDALKVGRFGVGFLSVFHITDLPMVISTDTAAILDPHKKYTGTDRRGWSSTLSDFLSYFDHAACFASLDSCSVPQGTVSYPATIFRFPLRLPGATSEISTNSYSPDRVRNFLYGSFLKEAPIILLFLKHVEEISLYDGDTCLYKVSIHPEHKKIIRAERNSLIEKGLSKPSTPFLSLYSMTTCVYHNTGNQNDQYHWLIFNMIGTIFEDVKDLSQNLQVLPWVGIAAPLPSILTFHGIRLENVDMNRLSGVLLNLQRQLKCHTISLPWNGNNIAVHKGHAFCFLPLPDSTHLPVHIHGYFSISDNRRSIEWPSADNESDKAVWNNMLVLKHIAPLYAIMISCRSQLITYKGTPLPAYNKDQGITDPYIAWPLFSEVKHMQIWSELVNPTVQNCVRNPVFWSMNGKWVTADEALFLPKSSLIPSKALQILVHANVAIVSLPNDLWQTIEMCFGSRISEFFQTISPTHVRNAIKRTKFGFKSNEDLLPVLEYCLSDLVTHGNYKELEGLNMISLATPHFRSAVFSSGIQHHLSSIVYVLDSNNRRLYDVLPGVEASFASISLMSSSGIVEKSFINMASRSLFQLCIPTPSDVCKNLLPQSIKSWSPSCHNQRITFTPGRGNHPPVVWIAALWAWLCDNPSVLPNMAGLPILPRDIIDEGTTSCVLLPIPSGDTKYYDVSQDGEDYIVPLFEKLGAVTLKQNGFVFMHKRIKDFILQATIPNLLTHLAKLGLSKIHNLNTDYKNLLRYLIAHYYFQNQLPLNLQKLVIRLPIFEAGVGSSTIKLTSLEGGRLILPPQEMLFSPHLSYPPNILENSKNDVYTLISKRLNYAISTQDDVLLAILSFAINECHTATQWSNGDNVILWVMTVYPNLSKTIKSYLADKAFIRTNLNSLKNPKELYSSADQQFHKLFNGSTDDVFPCDLYIQYGVLNTLVQLGLQAWPSIVQNQQSFAKFLADRAKSVISLSREEGFKRSSFIMELIGLHSNQRNVHIVNKLKSIKFLSVQLTPPNNFPCTGLPWYGKEYTNKLESLDKVCYNIDSSTVTAGISQYNTNTQYLVCGSVLPVLSSDYGKSMSVQLPLVLVQLFLQPKVEDVIQQLSVLIKAFPEIPPPSEIPKIDCMVKAIYGYLNTTSSPFDFPRQWIWSNVEQGTYKFMMAERFVLNSKFDLSPFIFSITNTTYLLQYRQLLQKGQICSSLSCDKLVETLHGIKAYVNDSPLPGKFLKMSIDILQFIEQQKHPSIGDVLLPTVDLTLRPASECTFDDREWNRKSLTNQSQSFLHPSVPPAVAKYFGVEGLSQKIAPSKKLKIKYIQLGQKESLTRKLRGIVNDYSGNIDVFKEVIQNADDAGASEVKFVLDYRQHGTGSLFNNGMKQWQGTAVLAYNNAVFSDQDFENICNLAAQTKMEDPLKIGRFGIGFCACYSLTDVPSFISRRNLSIFDPHTKFLGDRVSRNEPGMRLDLVTEKMDLQVYCDQLAPYDGVFGCNVFDLPDDGFNGTIFRFPIRTKANSEICKETYSDHQIKFMMDRLEKEAQTLLIFLKHITQLEVHMLDRKATKASEMKLLFKIEKNCNKLNPRVQMIKNYHRNPNHVQRPLSDQITVSVTKQKEQKCDVHCFVLASAISSYSEETKKGMVPMAELAIKINNSGGICIPEPDTNSMLFCFLPLPLQSSLPFHVNGYFDVGKDRRGLRDAQDSKEYTWNRFLVRISLPMAFEYALHCIASHFNPSPNNVEQLKVKKKFLNNYYSLWPTGASQVIRQTGWISNEFYDSVRSLIPKYTQPILWSDKAVTGSWVQIAKVCLFKNSNAIQDDIKKDAIRLLQEHGYQIVNCPVHVYELLSPIATRNRQIIDYEAFFKICFISNLAKFPKETRDKHLKFVLESCERIQFIQDGGQFNWTKEVLSSNQCIPVKGSTFAFPNQLINTASKHIADLFDVSEGRFIKDDYVRYINVLVQLGMVNNELPLEELVKRAQTVQTLTEETGKARVVSIFNYIEHTYRSYSHQTSRDKNKLIAGLSRVYFLKPFLNPHSKFLPWYQTTSRPYYRPSELYRYQYLCLLFSQAPVFCLKDYEDTDVHYTERLPSLLGINEHEPTVSMVLNNLCCLLQKLSNLEVELSETDSTFINTAFETMYEFLSSQCRAGKAGEIFKRLAHSNCIWQNNKLLNPSQVIWEGDIDYYPYLCSLSFTNRRFEELFTVIRVEKKPSSKFLLNVLGRLKTTYGEKSLSKEHLELVEFVSKKLSEVYGANDREAILPDEKGILRSCDKLSSDNIGSANNQWVLNTPVFIEFLAKGGHFLHPSIPRLTASMLGVRTLINAVLKDIEDHNFLDETDFCQYEDLVDRINGILKKYPPDISIFKEFIQNSDDAKASEIVFVLDCRVNHPTEKLMDNNANWKSLQSVPALCIFNNRPFTDDDIKGICRLGRGSKGETSDTIGRFGIGFNVAYHLTDCPMFVSFDEKKSPTDFCVFDPLRVYCSTSSKRGRRLKGSDGKLNSFSDQLSPFLFNCFGHMQQLMPSCFKDINEGFTVFRLPLKHTVHSSRENYLCESQVHNAHHVKQLLTQLMSSSEDMLLFLNHVKQLSAFEITETGTVLHYFSSTKSMGLTNQPNQQLLQPISVCKELCLTTIHQQTRTAPSRWIVHKQSGSSVKKVGGKELLCDIAKKRGLEAVGGTATKVDYANTMENGKLFCFLPLSIDSCLPVHLNGHFLIDDSRNHLDRATVGLENWNFDLAQNILVPSYVQLILKAKEYVTSDNEQSVKWFYNLFPNLLSTSVSAASTLKVNEQLYKYLLHENQSILLDHGQFLKGNVKWLQLDKGAIGKFYLNFNFKKRRIMVEEKIRGVLLSLGMLITCAPIHVFNGFCQVSFSSYATTSIVTPENVIDFLRNITLNDKSTKLILEHCIPILEFCLQDCFNEVMIRYRLKNTPILKNKANRIIRMAGVLYSSIWSHLLPSDHINLFAHPSLETGTVGKKLREGFVIIDPPLEVIVKLIDLPDVNGPVTLADHHKELVKSLWNFLSRYESSNYSLIFKNKPIIPSLKGTFYPAKLQKCLFINSEGQATMLSALQKLGYPCVDFNLISIPELPLFVTHSISNPSHPNDVIMAMNLLPPPFLTVELNKKEYSTFIYVLGHAENIPKQVCTLLRQMPLFETIEGTHCSLGPKIARVIFVPEGVPLNGLKTIETSCKSVFLKSPNDSQNKFYNKVFTLNECRSARISLVRFYSELAVPKFELLSDDQVKAHLKVINKSIDLFIGIDDCRKQLIKLMAQTSLITIEKKRYCVSDFYDPKNKFYYEFYPRKVLPAGDWAEGRIISHNLLRKLGLKVVVTHEEWLQVAQYVVNQWMKRSLNTSSKQSEYYHSVKRLDILFECFKEIANKEGVPESFLTACSTLKFIHHPDPPKLEELLKRVVSWKPSKPFECFIEPSGAAFNRNRNLVCLSHPILPVRFDFLLNSSARTGLKIVEPITCDMVVDNLVKLSQAILSNNVRVCAPSQTRMDDVVELKRIFEEHYRFLDSRHKDLQTSCKRLRNTPCFLISSDNLSLAMVPPSHLVKQLPKTASYEPFCIRLPSELTRYPSFLKAVGVKEELDAIDFITILLSIKKLMEGMNMKSLEGDEKLRSLCNYTYNSLVINLRNKRNFVISKDQRVVLPTIDYQLLDHTQLIYNDIAWIADYLDNQKLPFLLPPPRDANGQKIPPLSLQVQCLSKVAVQELSKCVLHPSNKCTEHELYLSKKKLQNCCLVRDLVESLESPHFKSGMERIYWHENQEHPSSNGKFCKQLETIMELNRQQAIHCVNTIQTIVIYKNVEVAQTEDNSHLCYISKDNGQQLKLFVTHDVAHFTVDQFLEQLAGQIKEILGNFIKNELLIKSVLNCRPDFISQVLDTLKVRPFDSTISVSSDKSLSIGTTLSIKNLNFKKENLIIFYNYQIGEKVVYHCIVNKEPVLRIGKVVELVENKQHYSWPLNTDIKLSTNSSSQKPETTTVSFFHIYKELTLCDFATLNSNTHQPQYTTPLLVLPVPIDSRQKIRTWLVTIINRNRNKQYCLMAHLRQRLLAHLHYYFMTTVCNHELYLFATSLLFELMNEDVDVLANNSPKEKIEEMVEKLNKLSIEGDIDDHDMESDSDDDDEETLLGHGYRGVAIQLQATRPPSVSLSPSARTRTPQAFNPSIINSLPVSGSRGTSTSHVGHSNAAQSRRFAQVQNTQLQQRYVQNVIPPKPVVLTDPIKAKAWLSQAKVDYLAACDIFTNSVGGGCVGESLQYNEVELMDIEESFKLIGTGTNMADEDPFRSNTPDHRNGSADSPPPTQCKYPALVCFLSHEVVEKCLKGIMYAKCGLPRDLIECRNLNELYSHLAKSKKCPEDVKTCLQHSSISITGHEEKCRFPNHHHPTCAPAAAYSFTEAVEAMKVMNNLMKRIQESDMMEFIGQLDTLPEADIALVLEKCITSNTDVPDFWDSHQGPFNLVLLDSEDNEEHSMILSQFRTSLPKRKVLRIERIQNKVLWKKYTDCAKRMKENNNGRLSTMRLFHGTRTNPPEWIYKGDASFDMRFSNKGLWGKGNYFAVNASYSHSYSHEPIKGQYQMLLAYVLTGYSFRSKQDGNLTRPPIRTADDGVQLHYDSVMGITCDSAVYITYNNDHAYPAYLITYR